MATELESNEDAMQLAQRLAGRGWLDIEEAITVAECTTAQLTRATRLIKCSPSEYVVESRMVAGRACIRITTAPEKERLARQLAADMVAQLAKLYLNVHRSKRTRQKLAQEIEIIASRLAPFLEAGEFERQYQFAVQDYQRRKRSSEVNKGENSPPPPAKPAKGTAPQAGSEAGRPAVPSSVSVSRTAIMAPALADVALPLERKSSIIDNRRVDPRSIARPLFAMWVLLIGVVIAVLLGYGGFRIIKVFSQHVEKLQQFTSEP